MVVVESLMAKVGRNQPCPCGSGKKYKRCCLSRDPASRVEAANLAQQRHTHVAPPACGFFFGEDDLDELSNRVVDLIDDGRLGQAEAACQELKEQYPEVIDWLFRTAMLHEARGEPQRAIEYYERTLAWMDDNPDDFEPASREPFRDDIERLRRAINEPS